MLDTTPFNGITSRIIGAAIEVHRYLGPGLLESAYFECLQIEMGLQSLRWTSQRTLALSYRGHPLTTTYRTDLIVEDLIVVELKSLEHVLGVHEAQVLTYMRIANCPLGLLINFNVTKLTDGVKRLINPRYMP